MSIYHYQKEPVSIRAPVKDATISFEFDKVTDTVSIRAPVKDATKEFVRRRSHRMFLSARP